MSNPNPDWRNGPSDDARSKHDNNHNYHGSSNPKSTSSKKTKNPNLKRYKREEEPVHFRAMNDSDEERARRRKDLERQMNSLYKKATNTK